MKVVRHSRVCSLSDCDCNRQEHHIPDSALSQKTTIFLTVGNVLTGRAQNFAGIDVATLRVDVWVVHQERRHWDARAVRDRTARAAWLYDRDSGAILADQTQAEELAGEEIVAKPIDGIFVGVGELEGGHVITR